MNVISCPVGVDVMKFTKPRKCLSDPVRVMWVSHD